MSILISFFNPKLHRHFLYSAAATGGPTTLLTSIHRPLGLALRVSGSSNDLVCLYDHESVFTYNPSLNQNAALPPTGFPMSLVHHLKYNVGCTIGYDVTGGVHQVVRACKFTARVPRLNEFEDGDLLEVIVPGEAAWRTVKLPEGVRLVEDRDGEPRGCLVDGALHYKALRVTNNNGNENEEHVIVSLSLVSEEIRVLKAPNLISVGDSLMETGGKLSLAGEYDDIGIALIRIYEVSGDDEVLRTKEKRVVKKKALFPGRRSCRETTWGAMKEDGTCTANVSLADGREVVLTGRLDGLNENGTFVNYSDTCVINCLPRIWIGSAA